MGSYLNRSRKGKAKALTRYVTGTMMVWSRHIFIMEPHSELSRRLTSLDELSI